MLPSRTSEEGGIISFLASPGLTVITCIVLAIVATVGSFLYRGDTLPSGQGSMRVFSSPFFVVPAFVLVVNVVTCAAVRFPRALSRLPLYAGHLCLVLAVFALLLDGRFGRVMTGYFPFQVEERSVFDWKEGRDADLPFSIEVKDYAEVRHPYLLRIGVKRYPGGEKIALLEVSEGKDLEIPGTGIVLRDLRFSPEEESLYFTAEGPGGTFPVRAGKEGSPPLPGGIVVVPVAFKERGVKEMKASLIIRRDGTENPVEISPNHPGKFEGYAISLVEVRFDRYLNLY
ncbi:MAG: hypothetical protein D6713_10110, partial [Deltaproteobacteria bacterium]